MNIKSKQLKNPGVGDVHIRFYKSVISPFLSPRRRCLGKSIIINLAHALISAICSQKIYQRY